MYSALKNFWFCRDVSPASVLPASDDWPMSCPTMAISRYEGVNTVITSGIGPNRPEKKNAAVYGGLLPNRQSSHRIMGESFREREIR
jgi:hypothetical protein